MRDLFCIASEYQKLVDYKFLYSTNVIKIAAPKFVVFYNGIRNTTDKEENGTIPESVRTCILKEQDEKVLRKWSKLAAHTGSIEEFWKSIEKEQDHEPDTNTVI